MFSFKINSNDSAIHIYIYVGDDRTPESLLGFAEIP